MRHALKRVLNLSIKYKANGTPVDKPYVVSPFAWLTGQTYKMSSKWVKTAIFRTTEPPPHVWNFFCAIEST